MASRSPGRSGVTAQHTQRSIVALLVSVFCTSAATMAGATALGKQVFDLTGRELDLGWLGLVEFAPAALLVLVTGAVADRIDRRKVVCMAGAVQTVMALMLAWYAHTEPTAVAPIFTMVLALGVARAFVAPAERALPSDIVHPERLPWLVARFSGTWQIALIVGPVLGGVLYAVTPSAAYVSMAVLFAISAVTIMAVELPVLPDDARTAPTTTTAPTATTAPTGAVTEALEGLRFIRGHAVVLGALSLDLFAVLFGGAVALLPAIAETRLGVGAIGLGLLRGAYGLGAAIMTTWLAIRPVQRRVGRRLLEAVAVFGAATILLGVTRNYAVAFGALAVLAAADAISVFIRATLVPLATPADRRGRVLAVENVFIGGSNELGAFESGVVGQMLGPGPAIALGGAATIIIAAMWTRLFPALRDIDRFPDPNND